MESIRVFGEGRSGGGLVGGRAAEIEGLEGKRAFTC
jgi:hypothetical protein